jgi:hypothetical protein
MLLGPDSESASQWVPGNGKRLLTLGSSMTHGSEDICFPPLPSSFMSKALGDEASAAPSRDASQESASMLSGPGSQSAVPHLPGSFTSKALGDEATAA